MPCVSTRSGLKPLAAMLTLLLVNHRFDASDKVTYLTRACDILSVCRHRDSPFNILLAGKKCNAALLQIFHKAIPTQSLRLWRIHLLLFPHKP